ncbi:MAG TPA: hypothetical protein VF964_09300 [Vicinamibacteria bacterium]
MPEPTGEQPPPARAESGARPRGRPPGSLSLDEETSQTILAYIRAGAFDHVAAEAAGVPARTFYDWMTRGEGRHPSRPPTRQLRAFAQAVRTARAEARVAAEVRVHRERPAYWLAHAARSKPDREGWTDPPVSEQESMGFLEGIVRSLGEQDRREGRVRRSD